MGPSSSASTTAVLAPCFGAPNLLRLGALPFEAGKRQAHCLRAHIPQVLWTHLQYFTWPRACHERFVMLAWAMRLCGMDVPSDADRGLPFSAPRAHEEMLMTGAR
jgi:hypothetical protein